MSSEYSLEKELLEKIEQLHEKVEKQEQKIERQERKIEELEEGKNVDRSHDPVSEGLSRRGFLKKLGAGVLGIGALSLPVASKVTISDSGISKDGSSFWFSGLSSSYDLSGQNITDGGTVIWDTTNSQVPSSVVQSSGLDAELYNGLSPSDGTSGQFLQTDGTSVSWADVSGLTASDFAREEGSTSGSGTVTVSFSNTYVPETVSRSIESTIEWNGDSNAGSEWSGATFNSYNTDADGNIVGMDVDIDTAYNQSNTQITWEVTGVVV